MCQMCKLMGIKHKELSEEEQSAQASAVVEGTEQFFDKMVAAHPNIPPVALASGIIEILKGFSIKKTLEMIVSNAGLQGSDEQDQDKMGESPSKQIN